MSKKLFAVYLGGRADRCNIELHDIVFAVGSSIEETYPLLAQKWFGNFKQFHIDSYICLEFMDGHAIHLTKEMPDGDSSKKLYFINYGGYKPFEFAEYHQSAFYVSQSAVEAVKRARTELCRGFEKAHRDDIVLLDQVEGVLEYDIDDVMEIREVDEYYVSLTPSAMAQHSSLPVSAYINLDKFILNFQKDISGNKEFSTHV